MSIFHDVFISYGRPDSKSFTVKLQGRLEAEGVGVWLDLDDIPVGVDYQRQIDVSIEKAHNFLFVISPHSVNSPYCQLEINQALKCNKRIIPLMHVEEISYETWRTRNAKSSENDWEIYRSQGRHSSFINMAPAISRINWLMFREGIDNFEESFQGLLDLIHCHERYVFKHTEILGKALNWEQNQKSRSFLLVGEERQLAEQWLTTSFKNGQPPCTPTNLHCEFVTESTKNSQNLMTQVFLAHAEEDSHVMTQILYFLRRQGITVWSSKTDIPAGKDFQEAINEGIEQADNIVYLLSPDSQNSPSCKHELNYAIELEKRVIPVLVRPTASEQIPPELQDLQYVDLTDNSSEDDFTADKNRLLKILDEDKSYYEKHKLILVQSLKWKRQNKNPSMLLRGHNLKHAEAWLRIAQSHQLHRPISLQKEFIEVGLRQPPNLSLDVFIAYSRTDSDFARKLNEALQVQGKTTWFDQESIISGSNFQQEIYKGIECSKNVVFILSPASISSPYCADEVEYAQKHNKRIVTVLHRSFEAENLHSALSNIQWIDFQTGRTDFLDKFQELLRTLESDREHLENHTKLLVKAIEWNSKSQDVSLLIRGLELDAAGEWLAKADTNQLFPQPTALQRNYILQSGKQELQEAQRWKQLYTEANKLRARAEIAELSALNSLVEARLLSSDNFGALVAGLKSGFRVKGLRPDTTEFLRSICLLRRVFSSIREKNRIRVSYQPISHIQHDYKREILLVCGADCTATLWSKQGQLLAQLMGHEGKIRTGMINPKQDLIATASYDKTLRIWDFSGSEVFRIANENDRAFLCVQFSPDGTLLSAGSADNLVQIWDRKWNLLRVLSAHEGKVESICFRPDGKKLASVDECGKVVVWDLSTFSFNTFKLRGRCNGTLKYSTNSKTLMVSTVDQTLETWTEEGIYCDSLSPGIGKIYEFSINSTNELISCGGASGLIKILSQSGKTIETHKHHQGSVTSLSFGKDNNTLFSAGDDGMVRVWAKNDYTHKTIKACDQPLLDAVTVASSKAAVMIEKKGMIRIFQEGRKLAETMFCNSSGFNMIKAHPQENIVAILENNSVVRIWNISAHDWTIVKDEKNGISSFCFGLDGNSLLTNSSDGCIRRWHIKAGIGKPTGTIFTDSSSLTCIGSGLAGRITAGGDTSGFIRLWDGQGKLIKKFQGHMSQVLEVHFSPDNRSLVTFGNDAIIKIWNLKTQEEVTLAGHQHGVSGFSFGPLGSLISWGKDKTVRLWTLDGKFSEILYRVQNGMPLTVIAGHEESEVSVLSSSGELHSFSFDLNALLTDSYLWLANSIADYSDHHQDLKSIQKAISTVEK